MQRLRLKFRRGEEVKFVSHLDIVRSWDRVFRRAKVPLAYSCGFTPRPRISVAAPLAVGVIGEAELMDIWLDRWMPPQSLMMMVESELSDGFDILDACEVGLELPSLQSGLAFAEYRVAVMSDKGEQWVKDSLSSLLQTRELNWRHTRGTKERSYDLRALICDLWLVESHDNLYVLGMKLRCGASGSGRPEQVVAALGVPEYPEWIRRTGIALTGDLGT